VSSARAMPIRFADTTALFEFCVGTKVTRPAARGLLQPRDNVASSDHAQREWKRITFKAVRDVLEAVEEEPDLSAVLSRLGRGFGRAQSQRLRALALIVGTSQTLDTADARIRGRRLLRGEADRLFHRVVGTLRAGSECGLAVQQPTVDPDGRWTMKITCQRREGICRHEERLGQDAPRWSAGARALKESETASHRNVGRKGVEMASTPRLRTGVNCYGVTGDLAIALDCRAGEELVTTDAIFEVMAPAMGFTVQRIPVG
jgi:hypothetical protein